MSRIDLNHGDFPGLAHRGEARSGRVAARMSHDQTALTKVLDGFASVLLEEGASPDKTDANLTRPRHRSERHSLPVKAESRDKEETGSDTVASALGTLANTIPTEAGRTEVPTELLVLPEGEAATPRANPPTRSGSTPRQLDLQPVAANPVFDGARQAPLSAETASALADTEAATFPSGQALPALGQGSAQPKPLPMLVVEQRTDFFPAQTVAVANEAATPRIRDQDGGDANLEGQRDNLHVRPTAGTPSAGTPADGDQSPVARARPEKTPPAEAREPRHQGPGPAVETAKPLVPMSAPVVSDGATSPSVLPPTELPRIAGTIVRSAQGIAPAAAPVAAESPVRGDEPMRTLSIQLHPATLGQVTVRMALRGDQLVISLRATREETARLLKEDQDELARILNASGYRTEIRSISIDQAGPAPNAAGQTLASSGQSAADNAGGRYGGGFFSEGGQRGERSMPPSRNDEDADETVSGSMSADHLYV